MQYDLLITTICFSILAACAAIGIFHPAFDDTLCQRVALAGICISASGVAVWVWHMGHSGEPLALLASMLAVYALETARKLMQKRRQNDATL